MNKIKTVPNMLACHYLVMLFIYENQVCLVWFLNYYKRKFLINGKVPYMKTITNNKLKSVHNGNSIFN